MFIALAIVALIAALAVVPIDTRPLPAHPHPIADFARAVATYDSLRAIEADLVMPDAASLIYAHDEKRPRSIVLIHGLTNSPRQFRELAEQFYERGYNVIVPRLPEHGFRAADVGALKRLTAEKYRDYADQAVDVAAGLGDSVFVIGLSAGGNVAAWIAQHRPDVTRVVVVAPAIGLARVPNLLAAPTMNLLERVPNLTFHQKPDSGRGHAYFGVSTRGLGETLRFGASIMEQADLGAPGVHDLAMVLNENDRTIDPDVARRLVDRWRSDGTVVMVSFQFDKRLALPHDVVDMTQRCGMTDVVYPVLIALVEKREPVIADGAARCGTGEP